MPQTLTEYSIHMPVYYAHQRTYACVVCSHVWYCCDDVCCLQLPSELLLVGSCSRLKKGQAFGALNSLGEHSSVQ